MNKVIIAILSILVLGLVAWFVIARDITAPVTNLTMKQQSIIPIASFAASGDIDQLNKALNVGLDNGLTVNEIKEILVQVYAYAGFPRSLNAINEFMAVMNTRIENGINDRMGLDATPVPSDVDKYKLGEQIQTELIGAPNRAAYQDFVPAIGNFLKEHLFGDIFGRGLLTNQEREIATVSMLASIPDVDSQLRSHMNVAMNTGITLEQLRSIVTVLKDKTTRETAKRAHKNLKTVLESKKG